MGDDPYGLLQDIGVLSRVKHQLLAGSELVLTPDELAKLRETRRLPPSVLARVGADKGRNQTILDSILGLDDDMTVLLFAASVPHAELLAGLLSAEGIPSRAISARTDRGARHHYIERFRAREIRVLTNFGVLTEGFDAPAVDAVYVARPTYSPNMYQQMIGRGLRGPLNGGKEMCLIVNVADNLAAYGESLAFEEWEHLWDSDDA
jgi:superfamily II DNA or RNA helicase